VENAPVRELLLVGACGLAREVAEAVIATNAVRPTWNLVGVLDDDPAKHGMTIAGVTVLGAVEDAHEHPSALVVLCPARADRRGGRRRIAERLGLDDDRYATIVHPSATVGTTCELVAGSVVLAHADLTADVQVGRHVVVMPQVVLTHDVQVGDCVTMAAGARLGGGCRIGRGAYIGSGACLREGTIVGDRAMVGMGAVVTRDVPADRLWYGVPARDVGPAWGEGHGGPTAPSLGRARDLRGVRGRVSLVSGGM
jgi:sugar O-acyltransferase (sialic acid O-acetyltransferase NeuD family)